MSKDYGSWSLLNIKAELRKRNAKVTGKKAVLVQRLHDYDTIFGAVVNNPESVFTIKVPDPQHFRDLNSNSSIPHVDNNDLEIYSIVVDREDLDKAKHLYEDGFLLTIRVACEQSVRTNVWTEIWTEAVGERNSSSNTSAVLDVSQGVQVRRAGRTAGVRAHAGPHRPTARALPRRARRHARRRGRTQDGVRGVRAPDARPAVELLRRQRRPALRTRHLHGDQRSGVHVRDDVGRRRACAERGLRARRPARLRVQPQTRRWWAGAGGAVAVGGRRVRRGGARRAAGAALPGRARARARRARRHEPAQQPSRQEGGEGAGGARVQVPRRVGLLRRAHVLARAAALPPRRRRAARQVSARQEGERGGARQFAGREGQPAARRQKRPEGRVARGAQVGAGVPDGVAALLRAAARRRRARHAPATLQPDLERRGRVRGAVLRARLQHAARDVTRAVPLQLPVVLPRALRLLPRHARPPRLQLARLQHAARDVTRDHHVCN